jgi:hypothetical protein
MWCDMTCEVKWWDEKTGRLCWISIENHDALFYRISPEFRRRSGTMKSFRLLGYALTIRKLSKIPEEPETRWISRSPHLRSRWRRKHLLAASSGEITNLMPFCCLFPLRLIHESVASTSTNTTWRLTSQPLQASTTGMSSAEVVTCRLIFVLVFIGNTFAYTAWLVFHSIILWKCNTHGHLIFLGATHKCTISMSFEEELDTPPRILCLLFLPVHDTRHLISKITSREFIPFKAKHFLIIKCHAILVCLCGFTLKIMISEWEWSTTFPHFVVIIQEGFPPMAHHSLEWYTSHSNAVFHWTHALFLLQKISIMTCQLGFMYWLFWKIIFFDQVPHPLWIGACWQNFFHQCL